MNSYESIANVEIWGQQEFGSANLGNKTRTNRLVVMAIGAANKPAGRITQVFPISAERQAAFKFIENQNVNGKAIGTATHVACASRCTEEPFVFVAVDGSSLSLADPKKTKEGFGSVGPRSKNGRGIEVMNAIAIRMDGTPLGLTGQAFWSRDQEKNKTPNRKRKLNEKETRFWFEAIQQTQEAFVIAKSDCIPWFQLDRGGDFRELLGWASGTNVFVTVRAAQNRRVLDEEEKYLWETVESQKILCEYTLDVSSAPSRQGRQAHMEVRTCPVTLRVKHPWTEENEMVTLYAVQTREVGTTPEGETPIEWMLLTNYPVKTVDAAKAVIFGYSQRWRVEEFHKTWKSVCRIEDTLLEESSRVIKWAIIMAAVAMRIERLKYLARNSPAEPATVELTRNEIDATIVLRRPNGYKIGDTPTIAQVVRWIADLGGYTGKSSGGPPGSIVIGRGLREVGTISQAVERINFYQSKIIEKT